MILNQDYNTSFTIMEKLIELSCIQFIDGNKHFADTQRRHKNEIQECAERDRQMRLLVTEGNKFLENEVDDERENQIFDLDGGGDYDGPALDGSEVMSMSDIGERLILLEKDVRQKNKVVQDMYGSLAKKREHRYVVEICSRYLQAAELPDTFREQDEEPGQVTLLNVMEVCI